MKRVWIVLAALTVFVTACGKKSATPVGGRVTPNTLTDPAPSASAEGSSDPIAPTVTDAQKPTNSATKAPTASDTKPSRVTVNGITYVGDADTGLVATDFELPLRGATGFASVATPLYSDVARTAQRSSLTAGTPFTVLAQAAPDTWQIRLSDGTKGYVENTCCYLNIADVVPSIVLDNTNSYASAFYSSDTALPNITGQALYDAKTHNPRLGQEAFLVACNWQTVKKLYLAQQAALEAGYTLVINEAFRPMDVQLDIAATLKALYDSDTKVKTGIDTAPWNISWFIANRPSTHQMGCAVDTSLAKVTEVEYRRCGDYRYPVVTGYTPCTMPTPIHELSAAAISLSKPVNSYSLTAWKSIAPASSMTEDALRLRDFCTGAGLSPLASEWWHFNDLEVKGIVGERYTTDPFYLDTCLSEIPQ